MLRPLKAVAFRIFWGLINRSWELLEKFGVHVTPVSYYSPIPELLDLRNRDADWATPSSMAGINLNLQAHIELLNAFSEFKDEVAFPDDSAGCSQFDFHFNNGTFETVDAELLDYMIRHFSPSRIVEIGSGRSTLISARACRNRTDLSIEVTCVDPFPPPYIQSGVPGVANLIQKPVQDLRPTFFDRMRQNDILFIDSSHIVRSGSDVVFICLEVLPRLHPGVLVHFHDIFMPREYPSSWMFNQRRFFNEQYMLQAFLVGNAMFRVVFAAQWMHMVSPNRLSEAFPRYPKGADPGSFWIQRVE